MIRPLEHARIPVTETGARAGDEQV